ncbi:uncharacterized protein [Drosophila tropicalis]|uniref:uncharacterized protein n=1 Tax=Drosophila tropicalis TaxID=46794 RepID=UPI0035ABAA71
MITVSKVCCCDLKWGVVIIGIIDLILTLVGIGVSLWMKDDNTGEVFFYICAVVFIAHAVACVLMIVSGFVANKMLVILYLITQLLRVIFCIIAIIWIIILLLTPKNKAEEAADLILQKTGNKYTTGNLITTLLIDLALLKTIEKTKKVNLPSMITVNSVCCCELKWGVLTIAIIDLSVGKSNIYMYISTGMKSSESGELLFVVALIILIAHIVGSILLIVSVFAQNKMLVVCYVVTQLTRIVICILFVIWIIIKLAGNEYYGRSKNDLIITLFIFTAMLVLGIWFWIIAYSWFRKLGGRTPVD